MNCKYSRLATAIMLSVGVSACGGGGSDSAPAPKTDVNVKLVVQDEYGAPVPNITVCLDSNGDELCTVSIDEQLKSTDSSGVAVQSLTKEQISSGTNLLAVVSNKMMAATVELCRHFFPDTIEVAIGEHEAEGIRKKPAPDTVFAALRELGVEKDRAVYVGDSDVDVQTAANSGLPCISVLWGFRDHDFLIQHGAKTFISAPSELLL